MPYLRTEIQAKRDQRDLGILKEFEAMVANGSSKTKVTEVLMEKYGFKSSNSIILALRRARYIKRIEELEKQLKNKKQ